MELFGAQHVARTVGPVSPAAHFHQNVAAISIPYPQVYLTPFQPTIFLNDAIAALTTEKCGDGFKPESKKTTSDGWRMGLCP